MTSVNILALGGTIAMEGSGALVPQRSVDAILAKCRIPDGIKLQATQMAMVPGPQVDLGLLRQCADQIVQNADKRHVLVQGTDTIEESAFLLELMLGERHGPVIVTGAMLPGEATDSDGPQNLSNAILCAASTDASAGVCVVLNGEVHAARYVAKVKSSGHGAFASLTGGAMGLVAEQRLQLWQRPARSLPELDCRALAAHQVAIVMAGGGDALQLIEFALSAGYAGLVIAALGAGHVHRDAVPVLSRLAAQMPVVYTSRTGGGCTATRTYGYDGSEASLLAAGLIPGGWLSAPKARALLQAALATGCDLPAIRQIFANVGGVPC
jgi:L-asparaginase